MNADGKRCAVAITLLCTGVIFGQFAAWASDAVQYPPGPPPFYRDPWLWSAAVVAFVSVCLTARLWFRVIAFFAFGCLSEFSLASQVFFIPLSNAQTAYPSQIRITALLAFVFCLLCGYWLASLGHFISCSTTNAKNRTKQASQRRGIVSQH